MAERPLNRKECQSAFDTSDLPTGNTKLSLAASLDVIEVPLRGQHAWEGRFRGIVDMPTKTLANAVASNPVPLIPEAPSRERRQL